MPFDRSFYAHMWNWLPQRKTRHPGTKRPYNRAKASRHQRIAKASRKAQRAG